MCGWYRKLRLTNSDLDVWKVLIVNRMFSNTFVRRVEAVVVAVCRLDVLTVGGRHKNSKSVPS